MLLWCGKCPGWPSLQFFGLPLTCRVGLVGVRYHAQWDMPYYSCMVHSWGDNRGEKHAGLLICCSLYTIRDSCNCVGEFGALFGDILEVFLEAELFVENDTNVAGIVSRVDRNSCNIKSCCCFPV